MQPPAAPSTRLGDLVRRAACVVRAVIGVPDYEAYLRHMHDRHPDRTPLTRDEFARQRMDRRYSTPGSRCC